MIELPRDLDYRDVHQWIAEGVVVRKDDPTLTPLFVEVVNDDCSVRVRAGTGALPRALGNREALRHTDLLCGWPTCGAVNVQGIALYVQRTQIRQYRRTYNSRALAVSIPDARAAMEFNLDLYRSINDFYVYTWAVYNTEVNGYPPPEQALAALHRHDMFSVALSPSIIVTKAQNTDDFRVWHNNELVAKVLDRTTLLPLCGMLPRAVKKRLGGLYANM